MTVHIYDTDGKQIERKNVANIKINETAWENVIRAVLKRLEKEGRIST